MFDQDEVIVMWSNLIQDTNAAVGLELLSEKLNNKKESTGANCKAQDGAQIKRKDFFFCFAR